jgi:hypothetical protein
MIMVPAQEELHQAVNDGEASDCAVLVTPAGAVRLSLISPDRASPRPSKARTGHPPRCRAAPTPRVESGLGHPPALQREMELRDQRPYLKEYNTGSGGPANFPIPQGGIIAKK